MSKSSILIVLVTLHIVFQAKSADSKQTEDTMCEGCRAVISEVHKRLEKKSSRSKYTSFTALDDICQTEKLISYKYSPPKMTKLCKKIIDDFEEDLESIISKIYFKSKDVIPSLNDVEDKVCVRSIEVCSETRKKGEKVKPEGMNMDSDTNEIQLEMGEDGKLKTTKTKKQKTKKSKKSKKDEL